MPSPNASFAGKRIGLIGFGKIAQHHIDVLRHFEVDIVGCFNRSESGRAAARDYGVNAFDSLDALMSENLDGVVSCVAFMNMHNHAMELLPYGVPVLMEKPAGIDLEEYRDICTAAQKHQTPVMVAFNRRHYGNIQNALTHIKQNGSEMHSITMEWSEPPKAILDKRGEAALRAWTFANTSHGLDLLTYLAGPIESPHFVTRWGPHGFNTAAMTGLSERNILASFINTWEGPAGWRLVIGTDKHQYRFGPLEAGIIINASRDEETIDVPVEDRAFKVGFTAQARYFLAHLSDRDFGVHSLESARPAMTLCAHMTEAFFPR